MTSTWKSSDRPHGLPGQPVCGWRAIPNPDAPDRINNVEGVHLSVPCGHVVVRVKAIRVVEDARQDTPLLTRTLPCRFRQHTGAGTGVISMNRGNYKAPDVIKLQVVDTIWQAHLRDGQGFEYAGTLARM